MASFSGNSQGLYIQAELSGAEFIEFSSSLSAFNIGSFTLHYRHERAGGVNENDINSYPFYTSNIKDVITNFGKKGTIGLTPELAAELNTTIDNMNLHTCNIPALAEPNLTYSPSVSYTWTNVNMNGIYTPSGALVGNPVNNPFNKAGRIVATGYMNGEYQEWKQSGVPICLFSIIQTAIDNNLISVSEELEKIVQENFVAMKYDTSFIWDVYINSYRENALKGGYKTESIIVRWSCDAVNKATEEFLQTNPDYEYRADNTLIRLSAKDQKNYDFSTPFFQDLYGTLETKIPMTKLSSVIGTSDFMKDISEFIPALNAGDCYLYLNYTFQNLGVTDTCVCQIPLNSSTQDVNNLYIKNGRRGSVVRLHYGEPENGVDPSVVGWNDEARDHFEDDVQKYDDDSSDVESDISFNSNISLLTTTYAMNESNLKAMGQKLWDASFIENIKLVNNSPIENILSVKSFPFTISGGPETSVVLGNVDMGVNGNKIPSSFIPRKTIGTFTVPKKFSGHLEWLNWHTVVTCYLPYIGFVELETKQIIDKTVTLKYIYDVITGVCTACFYADNIEIAKYSGTIAIDIPITASNRAQVEAGYIRSALGALGSLAAGNLLGVVANGFGALTAHNSFTTKGSPSPSCDGFDEQKAFIIIDYPVYQEPTNFGHEYGYPCNLSLTLGNLSGFTQLQNVDVTGLAITENEREELKTLLESGIYL